MQTNFVINIETSVLSSILFNPELMDDIANKLKPNDFYLAAHVNNNDIRLLQGDEVLVFPICPNFLMFELKH